ncbi:homoserine dehydrogenase [Methanofollis formosanus]|uniref:Homoserine dehydrogenase n=1 Tax=Methanofollis formosanus TaxID=299308 RepID=A0A8G1A0U4_9EURY|nr:homoserine dehydrogenase [Methanofollis formosanus]QYZ78012.1 homoserine dehydrogenase [Methanofollis formosanus]
MRVAVLGMGSVGRGVVAVIAEKGLGLTVTGLADSKSGLIEPEGIDLAAALERKRVSGRCGDPAISAMEIVKRGDYDVLVEVTPTDIESGEPGFTAIRTALSMGKHVVTSNKGPLALRFRELMGLAGEHGVQLRYEATVCGAIPIIQTLQHGLAGNTVQAVYGVMNGTCNYILTRMADEGLTYEQALDEAREMGYAEADPTFDVKGIDAALKLVILANTIWKNGATLADVDCTGIDLLTVEALSLADKKNCTIRLIGEVVPEKGLLRVSPRILPKKHPLVVRDNLNAVTVVTDLAGAVTEVGKGAGSVETASAVIGDLLFIKNCHVEGH